MEGHKLIWARIDHWFWTKLNLLPPKNTFLDWVDCFKPHFVPYWTIIKHTTCYGPGCIGIRHGTGLGSHTPPSAPGTVLDQNCTTTDLPWNWDWTNDGTATGFSGNIPPIATVWELSLDLGHHTPSLLLGLFAMDCTGSLRTIWSDSWPGWSSTRVTRALSSPLGFRNNTTKNVHETVGCFGFWPQFGLRWRLDGLVHFCEKVGNSFGWPFVRTGPWNLNFSIALPPAQIFLIAYF